MHIILFYIPQNRWLITPENRQTFDILLYMYNISCIIFINTGRCCTIEGVAENLVVDYADGQYYYTDTYFNIVSA